MTHTDEVVREGREVAASARDWFAPVVMGVIGGVGSAIGPRSGYGSGWFGRAGTGFIVFLGLTVFFYLLTWRMLARRWRMTSRHVMYGRLRWVAFRGTWTLPLENVMRVEIYEGRPHDIDRRFPQPRLGRMTKRRRACVVARIGFAKHTPGGEASPLASPLYEDLGFYIGFGWWMLPFNTVAEAREVAALLESLVAARVAAVAADPSQVRSNVQRLRRHLERKRRRG